MHDSKHIVILQSAHYHNDDRVFYHQAKTLTERGHRVEIYDCVAFQQFQPTTADIYIVDTPRAMWKVKNTTAKIIYDITDWYPSKKNLRHLRWGARLRLKPLTIKNCQSRCRPVPRLVKKCVCVGMVCRRHVARAHMVICT